MTRKKVKLAYIMDDTARRASYMKRKKSLLKKVSELSTLCGIDACTIIYSPYDPQPEVWPSTLGVRSVIAQLKRNPEMNQTKNIFDQQTFLWQRIAKLNERCTKLQIENRKKEINMLMSQSLLIGKQALQSITLPDLNDLGWKINQKLLEINNRLEDIKIITPQLQVVLPPPLPPQQPPMPVATNQIQPNSMQVVQEQNPVSQWFDEGINHPIENMGCAHGGDDPIFMPLNDNPTVPWPNALFLD